MRSGAAYGYGFITTAHTTLNTAAVAAMPKVSERIAVSEKPGLLRSCRTA